MSRTLTLAAYLALWVFALAFALVEAAVVVYLRALAGNALFPLHNALQSLGPRLQSLEVWREAATLILLLVPALLVQAPGLVRAAAFLLVFSVWDLGYYGFLWLLTGWPGTVMTYDILFLIPRPWISPVVCPVIVAATAMLASTVYIYLARNRAVRVPGASEMLAMLAGVAAMFLSFIWESEYYLKGGLPPRFPWWLFLTGYGVALLGSAHLLYQFARQEKARFF